MADLFLNDDSSFERMLNASFDGLSVGAPDVGTDFIAAHGAPTTGIRLDAGFDFTRA